MNDLRDWTSHPAVRSGLATAISYTLILAVLTVLLFLVPYAIFVLS